MILCCFVLFFRDSGFPESRREELREAIVDLIINYDVEWFYVCDDGEFNLMVIEELKELSRTFPHIFYETIVINIPYREYGRGVAVFNNLMIINGEEGQTREYALDVIKRWLANSTDFAITYVKDPDGCEAKYKKIVKEQGNSVIELYK